MRLRRPAPSMGRCARAVPAIVALLTAAACTSSGGNRPSGSGSASASAAGPLATSGAPTASASSAASSGAAGAAPFAGACRTAPGITSARVDAQTLAGGQLFRVQGQQSFTGGQLNAADLDVTVDGARTRVIVSDRMLYAKGPAVASTDKYVVVGGQNSSAKVRAFEFELGLTLEYTRPQLFCDIRSAATSVRSLGSRSVRGIRTQGYAFTAVSARLPATSVLRAEQSQNGVTSAATTMDVDSRERPVRITQAYDIGKSRLTSSATLYDLGKTVEIQPPNPSEISS